jgi:hypothetical protein
MGNLPDDLHIPSFAEIWNAFNNLVHRYLLYFSVYDDFLDLTCTIGVRHKSKT